MVVDPFVPPAKRRTVLRPTLLLVLLLVLVASADGAISPLSPGPNSTIDDSTPTFVWSTPDGETAQTVYVASDPAVTPAGEFLSQNVVDLGVLSGTPTSYEPKQGLYAGRYWWSVRSVDAAFMSLYSPPAAFTVREHIKLGRISFRRLKTFGSYEISVEWEANVKSPRLRVKIAVNGKRRRILFKQVAQLSVYNAIIGQPRIEKLRWLSKKRLAPGTRATLTVELRGVTETKIFNLPLVAKS